MTVKRALLLVQACSLLTFGCSGGSGGGTDGSAGNGGVEGAAGSGGGSGLAGHGSGGSAGNAGAAGSAGASGNAGAAGNAGASGNAGAAGNAGASGAGGNLYAVAGTVSGVVGTVSLHNGADDIAVANGSFAFPTRLPSGSAYAVSVTTPLEDCTLTNGSGTIAGADTAITIACAPPLVYYYPFDGDATDKSGSGHDGMVNGATLVADRNGVANGAYAFDGASWIEAAGDSLPIGSSDRTLTMWLNPNPGNALWGIVYWGQNACTGVMWGLGYQDSATFWGGCDDFASGLTIPVGTWTFVAVSFTAPSHIHVRVNDQAADQDLDASPMTPASKLWIGGETTTNDDTNLRNFYNGAIDSIRIYDRALTDAELDTVEKTLP